ncbi:MAG: cellulase family glycosylhydrolase [Pirellulales bacterium]|nr:cellulase family glycosylhydrolase [Pirellulales bacterium]
MQRRDFLKIGTWGSGMALAGMASSQSLASGATETSDTENSQTLQRRLPRWRGFNLLEKFNGTNRPFVETDFQWISQWGFDFVRLPMDYRCWTNGRNPYELDEKTLKEIDEAVAWGQRYGVHVNLNLHRAPGYTVAKPPEEMNLWKDEEAQKQFDFQWSQFAERYQGIPSQQLSFDLVNEPALIPASVYARVVERVVTAIRRVDAKRLIIADGLGWGRNPVFELVDLGIAQSTRGYDPMPISHYQASWVGGERWPEPTWPLVDGNQIIDRDWIRRNRMEPWLKLQAQGVGIHVGEWGAFHKTPHAVTLQWMRDCLELWKEAGWGWALWNFRGSFGILDSQRADVRYDSFHGHQLDRPMLELLQKM